MEKGSVAIVTGASSGLGLEISLQLASAGLLIVGIARRTPTDNRWKDLEAKGSVKFFMGDVSNPEVVKNAISTARSLGDYKLLINCAGQGVFGATTSYTKDDIDTVLSGNLVGLILFCTNSIEHFMLNHGTIVNVMSTASQVGRSNETIYCAAKWGARGYTEALRIELKGKPLRLLAVYPGGIRTPFWTNAKGHNVNPEKFMDPKEVAEAIISALAQNRSAQVTDLIINRG